MSKSKSEYYIDKPKFSQAVVDYVKELTEARESGKPLPKVPNYIAQGFLNIAEGLARRDNFSRYTYREELVMDAVENCLKAIENYRIDAATRSGKPNAFGYFTQISWYAFLRRIAKEKKQQDIKVKYMTTAGVDLFAVTSSTNSAVSAASTAAVTNYVDTLRSRIDNVMDNDAALKEFAAAEKKKEKAKKIRLADSNLEEFEHDDD
jgi:hypothetical protein